MTGVVVEKSTVSDAGARLYVARHRPRVSTDYVVYYIYVYAAFVTGTINMTARPRGTRPVTFLRFNFLRCPAPSSPE